MMTVACLALFSQISGNIVRVTGREAAPADHELLRKQIQTEMAKAPQGASMDPFVMADESVFFFEAKGSNVYIDHTYRPLHMLRAKKSFINLISMQGFDAVSTFGKLSIHLHDQLNDRMARDYPDFGHSEALKMTFSFTFSERVTFRTGALVVPVATATPNPIPAPSLMENPLFRVDAARALSTAQYDKTLSHWPETKIWTGPPIGRDGAYQLAQKSLARFEEYRVAESDRLDQIVAGFLKNRPEWASILALYRCHTLAELEKTSPADYTAVTNEVAKNYNHYGFASEADIRHDFPFAKLSGKFGLKFSVGLADGKFATFTYSAD